MGVIRHVTSRDRPERLAEAGARCEQRLVRALDIARSRAKRSSKAIRALLATATVEGFAQPRQVKAGVIMFSAPPFRGGLHQIWGWHQLDSLTDSELASWVSVALRAELARKSQGLKLSKSSESRGRPTRG